MKNNHITIVKTKKSRNYAAAFLTLIMVVSIAFPLMTLPQTASAADNELSIDTYAHLSVAPNPVGVGQQLVIVMWLDKPPPVPETQTSTLRAIAFTNFTVTVTEPDNTVTVLGPFESDSAGSAATSYVPDEIGNYTFQFHYGGDWIYGRRLAGQPMTHDYYKPSTSHIVKVSVQEEQIYATSGASLPTEYWSRPIDAQNYEWKTLAGGNWLGLPLQFGNGANAEGAFNSYSSAPNTAHILWSMPLTFGGIVGDNFNESDYYTGLSYQTKWNPPKTVVINGRLYLTETRGPSATVQGFSCIDLQTGEKLWFQNNTSISFGQLWQTENINIHGVYAYLWDYRSGTSTMYDAFTGLALLKVSGCQAATKVAMSEEGDVLVYTLNANAGWLSLWNSTKAVNPTDDLMWAPSITRNYTWTDGLMWNVTIPNITGQTYTQYGDGVLITTAAFREANPPVRTVAGYDAETGENLWVMNLTDYTIRPQYNFSPISDGCFAWFKQETTEWYGFDARTGKQIWGPTEPYEDSFGMYTASFAGAGQPNPQVAYGKIYTAGYDGVIHAIDIKTGKTVWEFSTETTIDTAYGHYPFYGGVTIADDKVFAATNEHTPNDPLARGYKLFCVNATTGQQIWNISSWAPGPVVANGYLLEFNHYDGELYCIGKGTSAVTVDAPMTAVPLGSTVTIRGTVTDTSPGVQQDEVAKRFPNGVPAVADQSMTGWMEYLYMQQEKPADTVGVPVSLSVIDGNGNYRTIGTPTTVDGFFTYSWKPDIEGPYTVYASFESSESYWPSQAITSFSVDPAPVTSTPQPTQPPSAADLYFLPMSIGTILAIITIGAIVVLMLRKRP